jgi:hypothetical protein
MYLNRPARIMVRRLIGNSKPAIWESGGPAHHRIGALIALFYRHLLNSVFAADFRVFIVRVGLH